LKPPERIPVDTPYEPLLTLKEAAGRLGVHPATLRRWADQGDVLVVITPGGHRRFARTEIERLAGQQMVARSAAGLEQQWATQALTHTRTELAGHQRDAWMTAMSEGERAEKRQMGQRLLGLLMQYIAHPEEPSPLLTEAQVMGRQYAESTRRLGMGLTEVLQAALFFRDTMVESAVLLPETVRTAPEANQRLLRRIHTFLNQFLAGVTQVYAA
jgi:excisionase family DNA binding protein